MVAPDIVGRFVGWGMVGGKTGWGKTARGRETVDTHRRPAWQVDQAAVCLSGAAQQLQVVDSQFCLLKRITTASGKVWFRARKRGKSKG